MVGKASNQSTSGKLSQAVVHSPQKITSDQYSSACDPGDHLAISRMETERSNLLAISKIVVRDLIQHTFGGYRVSLDETPFWNELGSMHSDEVLNTAWRLLSVIEHCLCHGLRREHTNSNSARNSDEVIGTKELIRNTTSVIRRARDHVVSTANNFVKQSLYPNPWPVLLEIERLSASTDVISNTVITITEIKTGLGRSRVWLRQALMRKQLGEYFQVMIDCIGAHNSNGDFKNPSRDRESSQLLHETRNLNPFVAFYQPDALLLNNEGIVLTGLLSSLKLIDFCFVLKDNLSHMDKPLHTIPYHLYLQNNLDKIEKLYSKVNLYPQADLSSSVDQKNFLEDLCNTLKKRIDRGNTVNQKLNAELTNLSKQMENMKLENQSLSIALAQLKKDKIGLSTLQSENAEVTNRLNYLESELKSCQKTNKQNAELVESLRSHLDESNKRCKQLTRYLSDSQSSLEHKQIVIKQLEAKSKGMTSIIEQMKERIANMSNERVSHDRDLCKLHEQLSILEVKSSEQSKVIENQTNQIESLKAELNQQNVQLNNLQSAADELILCKSKAEELTEQLKIWRKRCEEQECSLSEMAAVVNATKLEAESLRESHSAFKDAQWASDSESPSCFLCQSAFSVSRRRHHCRNCGLIFCHECSSRKMTLPSSAKPVRVCDTCHALLLHRYNVK
ncbi:unnamed protein product [Heterobilharzia americana]|nr:unnamed protein product [Heterobilharzia americana]